MPYSAFPDLTSYKGHALSLDPASYDASDNDSASAWCQATDLLRSYDGDSDYGTPGESNPSC